MLKQDGSFKEVCAKMKQNGKIGSMEQDFFQFLLIKVFTKILKSMKNFAKLKKIVPGMRVLVK